MKSRLARARKHLREKLDEPWDELDNVMPQDRMNMQGKVHVV